MPELQASQKLDRSTYLLHLTFLDAVMITLYTRCLYTRDAWCAGRSDQLVTRLFVMQDGFLRFNASEATPTRVHELLRRLVLNHSVDKPIPCCTAEAEMADLAGPVEQYVWQGGEPSAGEVAKGKA